MNRRQFLTRAIASIPAIAVGAEVLEQLLPTRTIFLPPRGGWLAQQHHYKFLSWYDNSYVGVDLGQPGGDYTAFAYMQKVDGRFVYLDRNVIDKRDMWPLVSEYS